jgi:hypothetical protein
MVTTPTTKAAQKTKKGHPLAEPPFNFDPNLI